MKNARLIREQLEAALQRCSPLLGAGLPAKGWIRAIRDSLGMTARQLAGRLGVAQQAVARVEKDELAGSVTIKTMRRVAECLGCEFVYGFVPHTSLDCTLREQARRVAVGRLAQANQTMSLEDQALSDEENNAILREMIDELVETMPANLWDEA